MIITEDDLKGLSMKLKIRVSWFPVSLFSIMWLSNLRFYLCGYV